MSDFVNYIIYKRCCCCFHLNEKEFKRCSNCNHIFLNEAGQDEINKVNDRISLLQKKVSGVKINNTL